MASVHNQKSVGVRRGGQVVYVTYQSVLLDVMEYAVFLESVNVKSDGRGINVTYVLFTRAVQMVSVLNLGSVIV